MRGIPRISIRQFRSGQCFSYLIWDRNTRESILIDASITLVENYRETVFQHRLKPISCIDTHLNGDHVSACSSFADEFHIPAVMSENTRSQRATRKTTDGGIIRLGHIEFHVLDLPGHTVDSIGIWGEGLLFCGDSLWIGDLAPIESPETLEKYWCSLQKIKQMPSTTIILPSHDGNGLLFSTLQTEMGKNIWLRITSVEDFKFKLLNPESAQPHFHSKIIQYNLGNTQETTHLFGLETPEIQQTFAQMSIQKFAHKIKEGVQGIDIREPEEFAQGHIPGLMNIPASEACFYLNDLKTAAPVYLCCLTGKRSAALGATLERIGISCVIVQGGFQAWASAGNPVEK